MNKRVSTVIFKMIYFYQTDKAEHYSIIVNCQLVRILRVPFTYCMNIVYFMVHSKFGIMTIMEITKKEGKKYNYNRIFNHTIYDLAITSNQFVVPWQLEEDKKERKDAKQLDLNFGL